MQNQKENCRVLNDTYFESIQEILCKKTDKYTAYLTVLIVGICIGLKWLLADNFLCSDFKCEVGDVKWLLGVLFDAFINIVTVKMEAQTRKKKNMGL